MDRRDLEDLYCQDPRHVPRSRHSHGSDHALSSQTRRNPTHGRIEGSRVTELEDDEDYHGAAFLEYWESQRRSGRSRLQTQATENATDLGFGLRSPRHAGYLAPVNEEIEGYDGDLSNYGMTRPERRRRQQQQQRGTGQPDSLFYPMGHADQGGYTEMEHLEMAQHANGHLESRHHLSGSSRHDHHHHHHHDLLADGGGGGRRRGRAITASERLALQEEERREQEFSDMQWDNDMYHQSHRRRSRR